MGKPDLEMRDGERQIGTHWVNYREGKWAGWAVVTHQRIRFIAEMNVTQYKQRLATAAGDPNRGTGWNVEIPRDQVREVRYPRGLIRSRCEIVMDDGSVHDFRRDTYGVFSIKKFTTSARAMFDGPAPDQASD